MLQLSTKKFQTSEVMQVIFFFPSNNMQSHRPRYRARLIVQREGTSVRPGQVLPHQDGEEPHHRPRGRSRGSRSLRKRC